MQRFVFLFFLMCINLKFTHSQEIVYKPIFGGINFYQDDKQLSDTELKNILQTNDLSAHYLRRAEANKRIGRVLSSIGGFIIGYQLANYLYGSKLNWEIAAIGGGIVLLSVPLNVRYLSLKKMATITYNENRNESSFNQTKPKLHITSGGANFGFILNF